MLNKALLSFNNFRDSNYIGTISFSQDYRFIHRNTDQIISSVISTPDQNLIIIDEAPIYNSSHLFGLVSVFNPDAVKNVELHKGSIPAEFGGRVSSVIDCQMKDGNKNKHQFSGGIGTLTAMVLISEITDFRRFPNPGALMAFLGLIPGEDSSADTRKNVGITKAGNRRCRTALIESVQHYVKRPYISAKMKKDLSQVDAQSVVIAKKCMHRLHKRYWTLTMKGKIRPVAITAIAREFVGFIWAMMMQPEPATA